MRSQLKNYLFKKDSNDGGQYINVAQILVHPSYNPNTQENDFSLLLLQNPIQFSSKAGAACLPPDTSATFVGTNLTISGWGLQSEKGSQSQKLKAGFVKGLDLNHPVILLQSSDWVFVLLPFKTLAKSQK